MISNNRKVSFSWDLHYGCNYRCPYCWWHGQWAGLKRKSKYLNVDELFEPWENVYKNYGETHIEILGGEPFIYPHFVDFIGRLSKIHKIRITTNLSTNIETFSKQIDSSRVNVSPTFHPLFADVDSFIKKAVALKENGFSNNINYLAYPPQIKQMPYYKERFSKEGLSFSVMTFWGEYRGLRYPEQYTQEEKEIIGIYLGKRAGEDFQISPKEMPKGRLCRAGQTYAVIQGDGNVIRCGGSGLNESIGNFFDNNFRLLKKPMPCKAECCKCNEWAFLLERELAKEKEGLSAIKGMHAEDIHVEDKRSFQINKDKNIKETLEHKIVLESNPLRLGIIATDWCNLRCIMCPSVRHKDNSTFPSHVISKIEELLPWLERIDWQGGEFLKFDHIKHFFSSLNRFPHIHHEITTNGLLLDEEWLRLLIDLNVTITFSIDSPDKDTYEYIRQGAKYEDLIERFNMIMAMEKEHGKEIRKNLTVVVMKTNYQHLTDFVKFVEKYGFASINFNPVMHINTEENIFINSGFDLKSLDKSMCYMDRKFSKLGVDFIWNIPTALHQPDKKRRKKKEDIFCNLPWRGLWACADRNGDVFPDCWCVTPVGNIFKNSFLEIWNNEKMQEYRRNISMNDTKLCNKDCISGYSALASLRFFKTSENRAEKI